MTFLKNDKTHVLLTSITGFTLFLFLIHHALGSSLILFGEQTFNSFSHVLRSPLALYTGRFILLLSLFIHIYCVLKRRSKGSRFQLITGSLLLLFTIGHIFLINKESRLYDEDIVNMAYITSQYFAKTPILIFTIVGVLLIPLHLGKKSRNLSINNFLDADSIRFIAILKKVFLFITVACFLISTITFSGIS